MGVPREVAIGAVRLSMGRITTAAEVEAALGALREALPAARAAGGARTGAGVGQAGSAASPALSARPGTGT